MMHDLCRSLRLALGLLLLVALSVGCAGLTLRVGPVGAGIAAPVEGPGVEAALSGDEGQPLIAGRVAFHVPGVLATAYRYLRGFLPAGGLSILGTADTPTGPPLTEQPLTAGQSLTGG